MPEAQSPLVLTQRHYNHHLFADRYLDVTLAGRTAWRGLMYEAQPVLTRVQAIFAGHEPSTNEAQTERELVRPVLEARALERRLAELVNAAYGLTAEEVDLVWRTAPPRLPAR